MDGYDARARNPPSTRNFRRTRSQSWTRLCSRKSSGEPLEPEPRRRALVMLRGRFRVSEGRAADPFSKAQTDSGRRKLDSPLVRSDDESLSERTYVEGMAI
jgi:hypothetical protein